MLEILSLWAFTSTVLFFSGIFTALHAVHNIRQPQSVIAWAFVLVGFPLIGIPAYLIFSRTRFSSYVRAREKSNMKLDRKVGPPDFSGDPKADVGPLQSIERIIKAPFTKGNTTRLLINGEATFDRIFEVLETAEEYIFVAFYIIKSDKLGRRLKDILCRKAEEGVKVYVIYDEMGSKELKPRHLRAMRKSDVKITGFNEAPHLRSIFRINFRNHRKIVVVDGHTAFIGGHNVGDEYLGEAANKQHWRDTHLEIKGPATRSAVFIFMQDWYWARNEILDITFNHSIVPQPEDKAVLIAPTGPEGTPDPGVMLLLHLITSARERLWIVSPYFVPEPAIMEALELAALKGVDVRIMLPNKPDHLIVWLAGFTFIEDANKSGIKLYRYEEGFLHQKVALIDDEYATVGTVNLDSRSLRLNFEITALVKDTDCVSEVKKMLKDDFDRCYQIDHDELSDKPLYFRFAARLARLFSPLL